MSQRLRGRVSIAIQPYTFLLTYGVKRAAVPRSNSRSSLGRFNNPATNSRAIARHHAFSCRCGRISTLQATRQGACCSHCWAV